MSWRPRILVGPALLLALLVAGAAAPRPYPGLEGFRWVGLGGGSTPDSNQVSIEQDLLLARKILGPPRALLYAGGAGTRAVQVADPEVKSDALVARLGRLFAPRPGRRSRYRATELKPTAPARADLLQSSLENELRRGGTTTLYVAAHGDRGEHPADAEVRLWGGWSIGVPELAEICDAAPEASTLRLVLTSCYSGGFADVLFAGGDRARGPGRGAARCGLFATTWDREASGCDPNPDRGAHEGYGIHFLHALRGEDREGEPLAPAEIDLDADGRISLLEAHTRVRLVSRTLDVPTTTSELWLRERAPEKGKGKPVSLPEERAVVERLGRELKLDGRAASRKLEASRLQLTSLRGRLADAQQITDEAWWDLSGLLLSRYPVLDDPYHPLHAELLSREGAAIEKLLKTHRLARRFRELQKAERELGDTIDALHLETAAIERLVRARENLELAGRLAKVGGEDWKTFERLRACERGL